MFRLMSGIFGNSLLGREFGFERLSECKCRSSRKSSPRDYAKEPFAVELGKSSPEKSRLLEQMKHGYHSQKNTAKERWFFTNKQIIFGLAKVLDRPASAVSDFLYLLTLQNFSKIMDPVVPPGNQCKVPFVYRSICEDYMYLFDTHGNIRSRFSHESLVFLMRVMQAWLKKGAHKNERPSDPCFGETQSKFLRKTKAWKAGIDRDSIAHRNGRRRLIESDARADLNRSNPKCYSNNYYASWDDSSAAQIGDPGYAFGMHLSPKDLSEWDDDDPSGLTELDGFEDELAAERARRLEALLTQLNKRTCLSHDASKLIEAIRDIKVRKPGQKAVKSVIGRSATKLMSHREDATRLRLINARDNGPTDKIYSGAQIPVLMHEPYQLDKAWTVDKPNDRQVKKCRRRNQDIKVKATDLPMFG